MRANIKQLMPHLYLIDDAGDSTCYLLCGKEKAMVIDTANGAEDLRAIVRTLTDLPLVVVNTHGHADHIFGNVFFQEAWMHPADFALAEEHFRCVEEGMAKYGVKPCPVRPLTIGQTFDLGGLEVEIVDLQGHTAGSIGVLDKQDKLLFSGDGLNSHIWMQLDHSLSIAALRDMLLKLKAEHWEDFDRVLHGHAKDFRGKELTDMLLSGCEELLSGKRDRVLPYTWFGGECLRLPISEDINECIVFDESKL